MKEYIDISKINDWNELEIIGDDGEAYCVYDVSELPRANVIEKEKIDKAIEEMKIHIMCNTDPKTGHVNILGQGQIMMLNILKKNIESEEKC